MAIKASNQTDLIDLTDGYSVILSSESYTFTGDNDSVASTQTTTTTVMALQGGSQVPCTVGTITGTTGITGVSDGKTPAPKITVTATSALASAGVLTIPVTIGDITINKQFSYAIAFTGATGKQGATGAAGVQGLQGVKGDQGIQGKAGVNGTSSYTHIAYADDASGTGLDQDPGTHAYIGMYVDTTAADSTDPTKYGWSKIVGPKGADGKDGATGTPGKAGVDGKTPYFHTAYATAADGSAGFSTTDASGKTYMGTCTDYNSADPTTATSYVWQLVQGPKGSTGNTGATGAAGADALTLVIISSGGSIFKNTAIATTLTAHVYKGPTEVTGSALTALGTIKWYKDGGTTAVATGQSFTVNAGDVTNKASYTAQLEG